MLRRIGLYAVCYSKFSGAMARYYSMVITLLTKDRVRMGRDMVKVNSLLRMVHYSKVILYMDN